MEKNKAGKMGVRDGGYFLLGWFSVQVGGRTSL